MATAERILVEAAEAAEAAEAPDGEQDGPDGRRGALRAELADTYRQTGELLVRGCEFEPDDEDDDGTARSSYEDALAQIEQALDVLAALGAPARHEHSGTRLTAGWLELDLGRTSAAGARARGVLDAYGDEDGDGGEAGAEETDTVQRLRAEARSLLNCLEEPVG